MPHIHTLKYLPSTHAIQTVSAFREQLENSNSDFKTLLVSLKKAVFKQKFMIEQDN